LNLEDELSEGWEWWR